MDDIEDFIQRRWKDFDANWMNGNCYWFAKILSDRFNNLSIYYLPVSGHFVAGDGNTYYDWSGKVEIKETIIRFDELFQLDIEWYKRLLRDCVL